MFRNLISTDYCSHLTNDIPLQIKPEKRKNEDKKEGESNETSVATPKVKSSSPMTKVKKKLGQNKKDKELEKKIDEYLEKFERTKNKRKDSVKKRVIQQNKNKAKQRKKIPPEPKGKKKDFDPQPRELKSKRALEKFKKEFLPINSTAGKERYKKILKKQ